MKAEKRYSVSNTNYIDSYRQAFGAELNRIASNLICSGVSDTDALRLTGLSVLPETLYKSVQPPLVPADNLLDRAAKGGKVAGTKAAVARFVKKSKHYTLPVSRAVVLGYGNAEIVRICLAAKG